MSKFPNDLIPLGKIIKPYGIKGQIKFKPFNQNSSILIRNSIVWLKKEDKKNKKTHEEQDKDGVRNQGGQQFDYGQDTQWKDGFLNQIRMFDNGGSGSPDNVSKEMPGSQPSC